MYAHQKLVIDKRRPKKENLYPVKIRITHQRIQKYYAVGIDMSEVDFDRISKNSVRKELRIAKKRYYFFNPKCSILLTPWKILHFWNLKKSF